MVCIIVISEAMILKQESRKGITKQVSSKTLVQFIKTRVAELGVARIVVVVFMRNQFTKM